MTNNLNPVHNISNEVEAKFVIAVDDDQTEAVNMGGRVLTGIYMPASWTTASLTFLASRDGTNFVPMFDSGGTEVAITAAASAFVAIRPTAWFGALRYLKVRSGTSASPVAQGADRTLILVLADPSGK